MTELFLILLIAAGITILMWNSIYEVALQLKEAVEKWVMSFKEDINEKRREAEIKGRLGDIVYSHIRLLLQITLGMGTHKSIKAFWTVSSCSALAAAALLAGKVSLSVTVSAALAAEVLPYGLLRLRLKKLQVSSSREGEILVTELLENYKIHYCNMRQAIEQTASSIEEAPNSRRLLLNLTKGLNTAEKDRIGSLLREFRLSINTSWGNILASNMGFALMSGVEVSEALADLADTVKRARRVDEFARRENNEAALILKYLAPVSYVLTAAAGVAFFGLSPEKFLYYQFKTEAGLTWFTISLIIYVAGAVINACISRTRLDL